MLKGIHGKGIGSFIWLNGVLIGLYVGIAGAVKFTHSQSSDVALYTIIFLPLALLLANVGLLLKALWYRQFLLAFLCGGAGCLGFFIIAHVAGGLIGLGRHP
ncbi:MAG: hypothetical protein EOO63_06740 [Hymenobacter sp.]|nr:MAG: hypothetical protein EOO63_06740 [Hymenobacter sp.]